MTKIERGILLVPIAIAATPSLVLLLMGIGMLMGWWSYTMWWEVPLCWSLFISYTTIMTIILWKGLSGSAQR